MEVIKWGPYFPFILATLSIAELVKGKVTTTEAGNCASTGEICHVLGKEELKNNNQKKCCDKACSL